MMRFKKAAKVEVLSLKESGSWCCAEIIGGNSHRYTVRFEGDFDLFGKSTIEKVPRKLVRPCPPPVNVLEGWVPGDVVEVLHNFSWKMATIFKVLGCNYLLVRLPGLPMDIKAHMNDVRARLRWQNGEWIVIGKASIECEDLRFRMPSAVNDTRSSRKMVTFVSGRINGDNKLTKNNIVPKSQILHVKTVKRKLSNVEPYAQPTKKKIKMGNGEILHNKFYAVHQSQLPEKVENVHDKSIHLYEMNMERENTYGGVGYSRSIQLESDDNSSVSSSVASCSVHRNPSHELHHVFGVGQYEDNDSRSSDAESFCQLRSKEGNSILPSKEALRDEIHRLELCAYRCTLGAFYALGPLNWEQQLLLTDLRDSLHITNDEHLMEIRKLVSSRIYINTS